MIRPCGSPEPGSLEIPQSLRFIELQLTARFGSGNWGSGRLVKQRSDNLLMFCSPSLALSIPSRRATLAKRTMAIKLLPSVPCV